MNALRYRIFLFILALAPLGAWGEDLTITTEAELRAFVANVNNGNSYEGFTVYLASDITLTSAWTPIGTYQDHPFKGHFEGWGHKISGLSINSSSSDYQGLFGYVQGGSIRDVAVAGSITGKDHVGGICGYLDGGEISSCYCEANVSGTSNVGGICGTSSGTIKDCYVTSTVAGTTNVGGILGEQTAGKVSECYMAGTVSGSGAAYHGSIMGKHTGGECSKCVYPSTGSNYYAIGGADASTDSGTNVTNVKSGDLNNKSTWSGVLDLDIWKIEQGEAPKQYSFLKNVPITFSFNGEGDHWQTIVPNGNYKVPGDMRAYVVQGVSELTSDTYGRSGTVTLHRVTTLKEGRGAIVYFHAYESDFNPIEGQSEDIVTRIAQPTTESPDEASYNSDTWLKGSHVSPVTIGDNTDYEDYILADRAPYGFAFYRVQSGTLRRGKAFIRLNATGAGSRLSIVIDGETTPVGEITINSDGTAIVDLYGHQLPSAPSHGLYIQNGKKIWKR